MEQARQIACDVINDCLDENNHDWNDVKNKVKDQMTRFLSAKTGRKPMILPIIMDV
jgi:ribonuclease J